MATTVTVKSGQTLTSIAKANNTTVSAILKANPVLTTNPKYNGGSTIFSGTKVTIPATGATTTKTPAATVPTVTPTTETGPSAADILNMMSQQNAAAAAAAEQKRQVDAIAAITALLKSYGIGDLATSITEAVQKGYSADTITLMMQDPNGTDPLAKAFQTRFPANKARLAAGKAVLSPADYLAAERTYTQVMQSYGVAGLASQANITSFLTNDISAAEVSDRVALAVNRVQNADANTKQMLATYYPQLNQTDIVSAMLKPDEALPALQRKVLQSEIGGAALSQGLTTNLESQTGLKTGYAELTTGAMGAKELADLGITKEQARTGFAQVAEVTPRATFLSSISTGEDYTRLQAEQEAFQGLASAKRARQSLTAQETARFGGAAGTSKVSLSRKKQGNF